MQVIDRVRRTIRAHALARPDTRVVVALSGGPDSVALAHLLVELDAAGELLVAGFAHFNHQLRPAAAGEERFCVELAASLGRPLSVGTADVASRSRAERRSLESAARAARYEFFERARLELTGDAVALGHTRDDQAETFLLRLLRGAGARGLAAMHPRRGHIVRPLLDCRRADLGQLLAARSLRFMVDESNGDVSIPRNRVRAELLPLLERRFNPSVVDVLADEAAIARDEWCWMERAVDELAVRIGRRDADEWRIDADALTAAPVALSRRLLSRMLEEAARGRPVSFRHVEAALDLARSNGPPVDGPGLRMQRRGAEVVLTGRSAGAKGRQVRSAPPNLSEFPLSIPGEVQSPEDGWALSVETGASGQAPGSAVTGRGSVAVVRLDRMRGPLAVRTRRAGDRFAPVGLAGRKKLQDFFVDLKVARGLRDRVPIVVDGSGRIVWVAGYAIDREFAVTDTAQAVLILRLKHLGGRA